MVSLLIGKKPSLDEAGDCVEDVFFAIHGPRKHAEAVHGQGTEQFGIQIDREGSIEMNRPFGMMVDTLKPSVMGHRAFG